MTEEDMNRDWFLDRAWNSARVCGEPITIPDGSYNVEFSAREVKTRTGKTRRHLDITFHSQKDNDSGRIAFREISGENGSYWRRLPHSKPPTKP